MHRVTRLALGVSGALVAAAVAGWFIVAPRPTVAAEDENPLLAYRQAVMIGLGWHIKPIAAMAKGEAAFDNASLTYHADALAALAAMVLEGYPDGSAELPNSDAKPEIWSDKADFETKTKALIAAADALAAAAPTATAETLGPLLGAVGSACKDCHKPYRN